MTQSTTGIIPCIPTELWWDICEKLPIRELPTLSINRSILAIARKCFASRQAYWEKKNHELRLNWDGEKLSNLNPNKLFVIWEKVYRYAHLNPDQYEAKKTSLTEKTQLSLGHLFLNLRKFIYTQTESEKAQEQRFQRKKADLDLLDSPLVLEGILSQIIGMEHFKKIRIIPQIFTKSSTVLDLSNRFCRNVRLPSMVRGTVNNVPFLFVKLYEKGKNQLKLCLVITQYSNQWSILEIESSYCIPFNSSHLVDKLENLKTLFREGYYSSKNSNLVPACENPQSRIFFARRHFYYAYDYRFQ